MRLLERDPLTGVSVYMAHDPVTGKNTFKHVQDVEPILDSNKAFHGQLDKSKNRWFVGTIPDVIVLQWAKESGTRPYTRDWHNYAVKQLNKAEYRHLNPNRIRLSGK